jgi:hypothetical protein
MEILSQDDMDARISSVRPLNKSAADADENARSLWCPEGGHPETRISIMQAKLIAANLTIRVLEAEKKQLLREFKNEQERGKETGRQYTEMSNRWMDAQSEVVKLRKRRRK